MTDYDLTIVPVVDDEERPIGIITVDDVLELIAPPIDTASVTQLGFRSCRRC